MKRKQRFDCPDPGKMRAVQGDRVLSTDTAKRINGHGGSLRDEPETCWSQRGPSDMALRREGCGQQRSVSLARMSTCDRARGMRCRRNEPGSMKRFQMRRLVRMRFGEMHARAAKTRS